MATRGRWVLAGLCTGALMGCAAPGGEAGSEAAQSQTPPVGDALLASARVALPPPMAAADLPDPQGQGAQLTAQFCGGACHAIPAPSAHSATDWPVVLRRMWLRAGRLDTALHVAVPDNAQRIVISEYLVAHALKVTAGDLPDHPGRDQFVATCTRCHGLPDVRQHAPQDWVAVVRRMNTRMETMLNQALTGDELQRIAMYLERASAGS